ncbi:hypothetical protein ANN_26151, partial [Periplaneta americana]
EICRIEKFLHFANNEDYDPETHPHLKLNEVWPIFRNLEDKYTPDRDVAIEESLLIYKGRLVWRDKNITLRLKDKKDVVLLRTIHSAEMVVIKDDLKPKMEVDYNNSMGGVDKVDQHLAAYPVPRNSGKRYYKNIFFHLLELALRNSFVLYTISEGRKTPLDYRMVIIRKIFEK